MTTTFKLPRRVVAAIAVAGVVVLLAGILLFWQASQGTVRINDGITAQVDANGIDIRKGDDKLIRVDETSSSPYELLTSPDYQWSAPENLGPVVNSPVNEKGATLTSDGLTLVFESDRPGGVQGFDLWISRRTSIDGPWSPPVNLGPAVNSSLDELGPTISGDGLVLMFNRDDQPPKGRSDLWMSTRASLEADWTTPVNLGPVVNSPQYDYSPELSADGLSLVFHSGRPGGGGGGDLWMSRRPTKDDPFGPPENLGTNVNGIEHQYDPFLSSDGRVLLFFSARMGQPQYGTLWMSTRAKPDAPWSIARQLEIPADSQGRDFGPALALDGRTLLFHGPRSGGHGQDDLWMVRRVPK